MTLNQVVEVCDCFLSLGAYEGVLVHDFNLALVLYLPYLLDELVELMTLQEGGSVHEVLVHRGCKVEQFLLEHLHLVEYSAQTHFLFVQDPILNAHLFDFRGVVGFGEGVG